MEGLTGTLAGGSVELQGRATYAQGRLTSFDLRPVGQGIALRYPEGIRSLLDADIRFFGDEDRQWLTGSIDVQQATYSRRYDVASELLATRPPAEAAGATISTKACASTSRSGPRARCASTTTWPTCRRAPI